MVWCQCQPVLRNPTANVDERASRCQAEFSKDQAVRRGKDATLTTSVQAVRVSLSKCSGAGVEKQYNPTGSQNLDSNVDSTKRAQAGCLSSMISISGK
jgi:hypothetical protein